MTKAQHLEKDNHLGPREISELFAEANSLIKNYEWANKRSPADYYDHGGPMNVAFRILERRSGVVATGISLNGAEVHIHGRTGSLDSNGRLHSAGNRTQTIVLEDFKDSAVASFVYGVCEILDERYHQGGRGCCGELKRLMLSNTPARSSRTRREVQPYLREPV